MTRTVTINLELLRQITGGSLTLYSDGSGCVNTSGSAPVAPHACTFSWIFGPNDAMRACLAPGPPTPLDDLNTVYNDDGCCEDTYSAYERLSNFLETHEKETER